MREDLYLVNFHDADAALGNGRSLKWATHVEVGKNIKSVEDIYEHLGLLKDWSKRDAVTLIKIPKGTDATFVSGKAKWQERDLTGEFKKGGGFQIRFRDFDEKWVLETKRLTTKKD